MTNAIFRFFGLFLLVLTVSACTEPPYNNLDNGQLKTLLEQGVPIYDIRRPEEWRQTGVIEGSRLLTFVDAGGRVLPDFLTRFHANGWAPSPAIPRPEKLTTPSALSPNSNIPTTPTPGMSYPRTTTP